MANFGFSISDIVLISNYAYSVYKSSKRAGEDFMSITADVRSLQSYLNDLRIEFENPRSLIHRASPTQREELHLSINACRSDLHDLKKVLSKYKSLRTADPRSRDKLRFNAGKQAEIKAKITTHSDRFSRFLSTLHTGALGRVEHNTEKQVRAFGDILRKLNAIQLDITAGKRDPSILGDVESWPSLEQELVDDGITDVDVEINREGIEQWLDHLRASGSIGRTLDAIPEYEANEGSSTLPYYVATKSSFNNNPTTHLGQTGNLELPMKTREYQATVEDYCSSEESDTQDEEVEPSQRQKKQEKRYTSSQNGEPELKTTRAPSKNVDSDRKEEKGNSDTSDTFTILAHHSSRLPPRLNWAGSGLGALQFWRTSRILGLQHKRTFTMTPIDELGNDALKYQFLEKKAPLFRRGDDIYWTITLELDEALCGWQSCAELEDGTELFVEAHGEEPTPPGSSIIPGEGMPSTINPRERGDLFLLVKIRFPTKLTGSQRSQLRETLRQPAQSDIDLRGSRGGKLESEILVERGRGWGLSSFPPNPTNKTLNRKVLPEDIRWSPRKHDQPEKEREYATKPTLGRHATIVY